MHTSQINKNSALSQTYFFRDEGNMVMEDIFIQDVRAPLSEVKKKSPPKLKNSLCFSVVSLRPIFLPR